MAGEQFSLCWDNFHSNMSSGLSSLYKTEDLVDVTLAAEGRYLKAHKMVLSVCSPYFRELFQVNPCKHPIVFLKDVSYNALSNLLEFMYQGEVKVSQDDLGTFIKTAEALKIKGLTGDGANQNDTSSATQNNVTSTEETPVRKNVREREKTPPIRKKPMGPASKRIKTDTDDNQPLVQMQQTVPQQQSQPLVQSPPVASEAKPQPTVEQQIMHFKMEPEETAVSLTNEEDANYDDSAMDDMGMDNSTDYLMESTSDMDNSKAGTSTAMESIDAGGDNQVMVQYVQGQKGHEQLVFNNHLYLKSASRQEKKTAYRQEKKTYWQCVDYNLGGCKCRCIITDNGELILTRNCEHTHPPRFDKILRKTLLHSQCLRLYRKYSGAEWMR